MDKSSRIRKGVAEILNVTGSLIDQVGPRLPGSEACIQAAKCLKKEFGKVCGKVYLNPFDQYPGAFYYIPTLLVIIYSAGSVLYFFQGICVHCASLIYIFGLFFFIHQFVFLGSFFDRFFRKAPGCNVIGIQKPQSEVKQQVIICGHHDSTRVCNFLEKRQSLYAFRIIIPVLFLCYAAVASAVASVHVLAGAPFHGFYIVSIFIICFGFLFILPLLSFYAREGTPGAGDNLVSSVMCAGIAKYIRETKGALRNTRLILLSTDGEEIGQKGSQAFLSHFKGEIEAIKTYVLSIDSIYKEKDLAFLETERNGTVKMPGSLLTEARSLSEKLGYSIKTRKIPVGGGGTDAGQFARKGIETLSLIGISTKLIRKDICYHTSRDVVGNIEPEALEKAFDLLAQFILDKDNAVRI